MTQPVDPLVLIAALTTRVEDLERAAVKAGKKFDRGAARIERHLADHAASGFDFRRAQTESPNERPPVPVNNYDEVPPVDTGN